MGKVWEKLMKVFRINSEGRAGFIIKVAIIGAIVLLIIDLLSGQLFYWEFWKNVLNNLTAALIELIVLGTILARFEDDSEKKKEEEREREDLRNKIERLMEELNMLRGIKTDETMQKICGIVKSLNKLGVTEIDFSNCYLKNAVLFRLKLNNSRLMHTNLSNASIHSCDFSNCDCRGAIFDSTKIIYTKFQNSDLKESSFTNSQIYNTDFSNADIRTADFQEALFPTNSLFEGAIVFDSEWLDDNPLYSISFENLKTLYEVVEEEVPMDIHFPERGKEMGFVLRRKREAI